jgi:hypothetical protein
VLLRILDRKPYGDALISDAGTLARNLSARDLILFASDVQATELAKVGGLLDEIPDAKKYYEPILAPR